MFDYDVYRDLVDNVTERIVSLSPATTILVRQYLSAARRYQFTSGGDAIDDSAADVLEAEIAQALQEIVTDAECVAECTPFELIDLQTFYGLSIPAIDYEADNTAVTIGLRFEATIAGYVQGIRYWNTSTEWADGVKVALYTNTGTKLQEQNLAINQLGWSYARLNPPILIAADTKYVAAVFTPDTGHVFKMSGLSSNVTVGNLKRRADNTGGVPTCPGSAGSTLQFPTGSSGGFRNSVDVEFMVWTE